MSSIRGIGDGYAFQRLLWLLIGTVVAPTAILTVFGVAAVGNQRAAILQELDRQQAERLQIAARELHALITAAEDGVIDRAARCSNSACDLSGPGVAAWWTWTDSPPIAGVPEGVGKVPTWFSSSGGGPPSAVFALGERRFAWQIDATWLEAELTTATRPHLPQGVAVGLEAPAPGVATPIEELMVRLQDDSVADVVLGHPLDRWRLLVDDRDIPTRALLRRNAWLYPVSLVLLAGLVMAGTFITLGSATREIRLSRLQTDFVSSVSHELRTPLTSIRMFVETLQSGRLDHEPQKVQECLDLLALETDRLSRMIERVLDWARMEAGRRIYEREPVEVHELFEHSLRALRSQHLLGAEADGVQVSAPAGLPKVMVDRDAIVEALLNLLQNAIRYCPAPRRIELSAAAQGRWVSIAVTDDGPGIAKQDRRRIFEKFYQGDTLLSSPTQKGAERGSGLGLAIVRAVARAHGGKVDLDSEVGKGSRFTIWLPVAVGE